MPKFKPVTVTSEAEVEARLYGFRCDATGTSKLKIDAAVPAIAATVTWVDRPYR